MPPWACHWILKACSASWHEPGIAAAIITKTHLHPTLAHWRLSTELCAHSDICVVYIFLCPKPSSSCSSAFHCTVPPFVASLHPHICRLFFFRMHSAVCALRGTTIYIYMQRAFREDTCRELSEKIYAESFQRRRMASCCVHQCATVLLRCQFWLVVMVLRQSGFCLNDVCLSQCSASAACSVCAYDA